MAEDIPDGHTAEHSPSPEPSPDHSERDNPEHGNPEHDPEHSHDDPSGAPTGERDEAGRDLERELSKLFGRARSVSLTLAAKVHPGLDGASYALLLHLSDIGPVRAADVVERTGLDKSTVSRQIARLEELELVERVPDASDGRARLVQLTATGSERLEKVRADRRQRLRAKFTQWSTADIREFSRLLGRLNSDL